MTTTLQKLTHNRIRRAAAKQHTSDDVSCAIFEAEKGFALGKMVSIGANSHTYDAKETEVPRQADTDTHTLTQNG